MTAPVPLPIWKQFFRVAPESAFNTNTATADWNIGGNGGGATGWRDMAVIPGAVRMTPNVNNVFQEYASGKRAMNQQAPVEGPYSVEGSFEMPLYLELIDPFLYALMGTQTITPTAGSAALASSLWGSWSGQALDTQSNGTEQFKFVVTGSSAATSASVALIQSAATLETITIGTNASAVDGTYYTKGAYDGTSAAITLTTSGTVDGNAVVSGVDLNTNVYTLSTSAPQTLKIEQAGQPMSASNSMFYNGVVIPSMTFAFDRTASDGMVTVTAPFMSRFPAATTAGTYANDAKTYYHPLQGWTASLTKDGAAFDKVVSCTFTITTNNALFVTSDGTQQPGGAYSGGAMVEGTLTILPEDATEWNLFTAQTVGDYHLVFTSPNNIVDSTPWTLTFEFSELYVANYVENVQDSLFGADITFRTTDDASDGIAKITNVCRMPV